MEKVIHFSFQTTNNAAEYETLLASLDLAKELKIKSLVVETDSQLVANQVQGLYEVKEQNLKVYKESAQNAMKFFESIQINLIKRDCIEEEDVLAKLNATRSSNKEKWIHVSSLISPSIQENLEITVVKNDWRNEIINSIKGVEFKGDKFQERSETKQHTIFLQKINYA